MDKNIEKIIDLFKQNKTDDALKLCDEIRDVNNEHIILNIKGTIYHEKKNFSLSKQNFLKSIKIKPNYLEAYKNLYIVCLENSNYADAVKYVSRLINIEENKNPISYYQLAYAYEMNGMLVDAIRNYKISENLGFKNKKILFNNLGNVLLRKKNIKEAENYLIKSYSLDESNVVVLNNLLNFYLKLRNLDKAQSIYNKIIKIDKNNEVLEYNKIELLILKKNFLEATNLLKDIIKEKKDKTAYLKLASIYRKLGKNHLAEKIINESLIYFKDDPKIKFFRAWSLLEKGDFEQGWKDYEFRKSKLDDKYQNIKEWNGEDIKDKKILSYNEQGIGDALQFSKYLFPLSKVSKELSFVVNEKLFSILKKNIKNINVFKNNEISDKKFDYKISLGSLIKYFYNSLTNDHESLLDINDLKKTEWSKKLDFGKLNVGIVWSGDFFGPNEPFRSIKLEYFENVLKLDANFYSLQSDVRKEDESYLRNSKIIDYGKSNLEEISALICNLDLIITVDTSLLHIASIQNKETWGLFSLNADFRWGKLYELNPYKNLKFYKQLEFDNWKPVINKVQFDLAEKIKKFNR